jgi:hypothetical protein
LLVGVEQGLQMTQPHACGPTVDVQFFAEIEAVFQRYPEMAKKYAIACCDHERDIMRINVRDMVGIKRIENDKIITEFKARSEIEKDGPEPRTCCLWGDRFQCLSYWTVE